MSKKTVIFFVVLFMFGYIIFNWNNVSWIFNYKEMSGLAHDFFNPYPESNLFVSADNSLHADYSSKYSLVIPSIGLFTPVVIAKSVEKKNLNDALDMGAVYYPGSVLPGQNGQIVILGHSAPPNWPNVKYDWIFSNIQNLNIGDKITLKYDNEEYIYSVVEKNIIQQGQSVSAPRLSKNNNILTLISCWPPGENNQRIAVTAELVK